MAKNIQKIYRDYGVSIAIETGTGRVLYRYRIAGTNFEFDLFSHVAESHQVSFRQLIEDKKLEVELYDNPREIDVRPHFGYYERLKESTR